MVSLITNGSAIAALDTLRTLNNNLEKTQSRVSSGYRVEQAADNAAYWSIATTMRSDTKTLDAVGDALGMAAAVVDTGYNGMSTAVEVMEKFKSLLVLSRDPGVDRDKVNSDLETLKEQMKSVAHASTFSGENWLWRTQAADDNDRLLVGSFHREDDGSITITDVAYEIAGTAGTSDVNFLVDDLSGDSGILTGSGFATELGTSKTWVMFNGENGPAYDEIELSDATTIAEIDEMISVVDAMSERVIDVAATLGSLASRVEMHAEFVKDLQDSLTYGVSKMIDADMDAEATRLKALETQRQLATQSLGIINASASTFGQLFTN